MAYVRMNHIPVDDDGVSFDGAWKKIKRAAKKVGAAVAAPLVIPTAAVVKATTHVAAQTGWKPLEKLNTATTQAWRGDTFDFARKAYGVQLAAGAAVGGAILAAPVVGAAAGKVSGSTLLTTGVKLATKAAQPAATAQPVPAAEPAPTSTASPTSLTGVAHALGVPTPVLLAGGVFAFLLLTNRR